MSKLVGFSVHPPAHQPASPKAVPRPMLGGVIWSMRRWVLATAVARHIDPELFTWQRVLCQNAQNAGVYVQMVQNKGITSERFWQENAVKPRRVS